MSHPNVFGIVLWVDDDKTVHIYDWEHLFVHIKNVPDTDKLIIGENYELKENENQLVAVPFLRPRLQDMKTEDGRLVVTVCAHKQEARPSSEDDHRNEETEVYSYSIDGIYDPQGLFDRIPLHNLYEIVLKYSPNDKGFFEILKIKRTLWDLSAKTKHEMLPLLSFESIDSFFTHKANPNLQAQGFVCEVMGDSVKFYDLRKGVITIKYHERSRKIEVGKCYLVQNNVLIPVTNSDPCFRNAGERDGKAVFTVWALKPNTATLLPHQRDTYADVVWSPYVNRIGDPRGVFWIVPPEMTFDATLKYCDRGDYDFEVIFLKSVEKPLLIDPVMASPWKKELRKFSEGFENETTSDVKPDTFDVDAIVKECEERLKKLCPSSLPKD